MLRNEWRTCDICKKDYLSNSWNQRYCSKTCNYKAKSVFWNLTTEQHTKYIVYGLPWENYAGMSREPLKRIQNHKSIYGRNTDDWFILSVCNSKEEAQLKEYEFQAQGWGGQVGRRIFYEGKVYACQHHVSLATGQAPGKIKRRCGSNNFSDCYYLG